MKRDRQEKNYNPGESKLTINQNLKYTQRKNEAKTELTILIM